MFSSIFSGKRNIEDSLVGFEDVLGFISRIENQSQKSTTTTTTTTTKTHLLINTLTVNEQQTLIKCTLLETAEEKTINQFIDDYDMDDVQIILYGKNSADGSVWEKYRQLFKLGFREIYIYSGGLFEWLLLQETYGQSAFPTTAKCSDILYYRAPKRRPQN